MQGSRIPQDTVIENWACGTYPLCRQTDKQYYFKKGFLDDFFS